MAMFEFHPGRPTDYDEKYCQTVIEIMSKGEQRAGVCRKIGICLRTFSNWIKKYKEFAEAYELAKTYNLAWWEDKGRHGVGDRQFNHHAWRMMVFNAHRAEYSDERRVKIKGLQKAESYSDINKIIKNSLAEGELTPDEALKISQAMFNSAKMEELIEIKSKLAELEEAILNKK